MSFQLIFLGYYPIKSLQLKKQTHSIKRINWSHRERTVQEDGPRWTAEADGFRWTAIADSLRRTALEDGPGGRRTATPSGSRRAVSPLRPSVAAADGRLTASPSARRTSVGSSDATGRPADVAVDVRTRDNPATRKVPISCSF
jgi:hypothetical protein